jgi:hypothetical protein
MLFSNRHTFKSI